MSTCSSAFGAGDQGHEQIEMGIEHIARTKRIKRMGGPCYQEETLVEENFSVKIFAFCNFLHLTYTAAHGKTVSFYWSGWDWDERAC